ncbi:hypothetical protein VRZ08_19610 [Rhodopseudomonas sp. G2_2311]|uniref:hypothetical protein n=1 Tax=Rhodopseudomonas sp. G2_2311 TaxID=3114287 RepID=UPI0039C74127
MSRIEASLMGGFDHRIVEHAQLRAEGEAIQDASTGRWIASPLAPRNDELRADLDKKLNTTE